VSGTELEAQFFLFGSFEDRAKAEAQLKLRVKLRFLSFKPSTFQTHNKIYHKNGFFTEFRNYFQS
jgi:hypothetical protein